jgi:uncharacterized protein with PIN domain
LKVDIATVAARHADIARKAFRHYGRHAANFNFGDCFAYALAKDKWRRLGRQARKMLEAQRKGAA